MIQEALYDVFVVLKVLFGLGALMTLLAIGLVLLWFVGRTIAVEAAGRPRTAPVLRSMFIECSSSLNKRDSDILP